MLPTSFVILSQSGVGTVIARSLIMIALIIVAFLLVVRLRRWLTDDDSDQPTPAGFSLSDLKQLHREGKISTEEFERAREKMVGAAKEMTSKLPDPLEGSRRRQQPPPPQ